MKEEMKSEFISKMESIAQEATQLVKDDTKKSVIIIATDTDDDGTGAIVAIAGKGGEIAKGIAELATNEETKHILVTGLKMAQAKMMMASFEKMFGDNEKCSCDKCKEKENDSNK